MASPPRAIIGGRDFRNSPTNRFKRGFLGSGVLPRSRFSILLPPPGRPPIRASGRRSNQIPKPPPSNPAIAPQLSRSREKMGPASGAPQRARISTGPAVGRLWLSPLFTAAFDPCLACRCSLVTLVRGIPVTMRARSPKPCQNTPIPSSRDPRGTAPPCQNLTECATPCHQATPAAAVTVPKHDKMRQPMHSRK